MGESELAKELLDSIKNKSTPDTVQNKYFAYKGYLRNLACFRKPDYSEVSQVEKAYNRWKEANNIQ